MKRSRCTKILATLGPSSSDEATILALFKAGADVFRINMSHTDHAAMRGLVAAIRSVEDTVGRPIGILADLQGPKLRLGVFADDKVELEEGATFRLDSDETPGDATRVQLPHPEILEALEPGHRLLIDDGKVKLIVETVSVEGVDARVAVAGTVSNRKGVSVPDTTLALSAMTPKDRRDLDAVVEAEVDWVALSFIQRPDDLAEVRKITRGRVGVMAKIEKPQAIERLDDIIELSDALMVARGDLGVEMPLEKVPGLQKRIVRAARRAGKPVVVATQMLESMISSPTPTRAEVSDVATAVFEGADAVMLSGETAVGEHPDLVVDTMTRIIRAAEDRLADLPHRATPPPIFTQQKSRVAAIAHGAWHIAADFGAEMVVAWSQQGTSARFLSQNNFRIPILAYSSDERFTRRMAVLGGVSPLHRDPPGGFSEFVKLVERDLAATGWAKPGAKIVILGGEPFGKPHSTSSVVAHIVREPE